VSGSAIEVLDAIEGVAAPEWDALIAHEPDVASPFVRHAFLAALEGSGAASPRSGWRPRHVLVRRGRRLVAAAPAYAKDDSDGDFSRDWEWAHAAMRARRPWYPKLVVGVPFTPASGRRVLVAPGEDRAAAVATVAEALRRLASDDALRTVQVLFPGGEEAAELEAAGLALRIDYQYHWRNAGYRSMDDFLARFSSKRRNTIRRELRAPAEQGIAIRTVRGDELSRDPEGWAREIETLHAATVDQMAWGMRWVNRRFFARVLASMPDAVEVVEARRAGRLAAMAFNLASPRRLFGRYWGCVEEHPFLHFNVALYHSIAECIARGVAVFEGGAGGEHKLARGFEPAETWSAHLFLDSRLDAPLRDLLREEQAARRDAVGRWREEHQRLG
jgi:predicted N-acyltransferase